MKSAEDQAAYEAGDFDSILAEEIAGYLQLDDDTLAGHGLRRDVLESQLADLQRDSWGGKGHGG